MIKFWKEWSELDEWDQPGKVKILAKTLEELFKEREALQEKLPKNNVDDLFARTLNNYFRDLKEVLREEKE